MAEQEFNPTDYTVDEVVAHLATSPQEERDRVLAVEQGGKARAGVLNWAPPASEEPPKIVKYVGTADVRRITKADWKSIGIEAEALEWSVANNHSVPLEGLNADVVEYLTAKDDGFKVVDKA